MAVKDKVSEPTEEELGKMDEMALARGNEFLHALEPYGQVALVREMARRIQVLDKSETPLNGNESAHLAQLAIAHNLNPFSGEMWGWVQIKNGKRHFSWMPGRKGLIRHANEQAREQGIEWWYDEAELTEAEKVRLSIPKDAIAIRCNVYDSGSMTPWRETLQALIAGGMKAQEALKVNGKPPCSTGVGVLTKAEMSRMPKNNKMPHVNRCSKRALTEALKHKFHLHFGNATGGGDVTFDEYLADDKGAIDVEFKMVEDEQKERMNPEYWGGICEGVVEAKLAKDAFIASEVLSYTPLQPQGLKLGWAIEFFEEAQNIFKENPKMALEEVADRAYRTYFGIEDDIEEGEFTEVDENPHLEKLQEALGNKAHAKVVANNSQMLTSKTKKVIFDDYVSLFKQGIEQGKKPKENVDWVDNIVANKETDGQYK